MVPPQVDNLKVTNIPKVTKTIFGEFVENLNYVHMMC